MSKSLDKFLAVSSSLGIMISSSSIVVSVSSVSLSEDSMTNLSKSSSESRLLSFKWEDLLLNKLLFSFIAFANNSCSAVKSTFK